MNAILYNIGPSRFGDTPTWKLSQSGTFSVESLYKFLNNGGLACPYYKVIWKAAIPLKGKVFLWLMVRNKMHTGANLAKKGSRILLQGAHSMEQMKRWSPISSLNAHRKESNECLKNSTENQRTVFFF